MGKIESYLGFAIKSGKIIYGIDNVVLSKKRKYLLVVCPTATENLRDKVNAYATKIGVPVVMTEQTLGELLNKTNCKVVAIIEPNLAKAVISSVGR